MLWQYPLEHSSSGGSWQYGSNCFLPLKYHQGRSTDRPPATGHQCLLFLFDFYLTYYRLISSQWSWQHFEAPLKTELSNGISAPPKIHLFFIFLMCVPASGSMTCTTYQFFFPSCCPFDVSTFQFPLFSLQVMDPPPSIYWYSSISSLPSTPTATQASADACFSCPFSALHQTFSFLSC